jgi:hypothetical protein
VCRKTRSWALVVEIAAVSSLLEGQEFFSLERIPTGDIYDTNVADIDGNGLDDLVVVQNNPATISVYLRKAPGAFEEPIKTDVSALVDHVQPITPFVIGDIDNDGIVDGILNPIEGTELVVVAGAGDGTFHEMSRIGLPQEHFAAIGLGDLNNDGALDVLVDNVLHGAAVLTFLGDGIGGFEAGPSADVSAFGVMLGDLVCADFNHDGNLDFAASEFLIRGVVVVGYGRGDGGFEEPLRSVEVCKRGLRRLAYGDVTGDGIGDILASAPGEDPGFAICPGTPDGFFGDPQPLAVPSAWGLHVADLDEDGIPDLLCETWGTAAIQVRLGKEDLETPHSYLATGGDKGRGSVMDIDGDGHLDVISIAQHWLGVLRGAGDGTFDSLRVPVGGCEATYGAAGDFNEDGLVDIVAVCTWANALELFLGTREEPWFLDGDELPLCEGVKYPSQPAAGDFNNDGHLDVAMGNEETNIVTLLLGKGDGTFAPPSCSSLGVSLEVRGLDRGDFDNDGNEDLLAVVGTFSQAGLLRSRGDGTFESVEELEGGPGVLCVAAADMNADGDLDAITVAGFNQPKLQLWFLRGHGDGSFSSHLAWEGDPYQGFISGATIADADGDTIPDVIVSERFEDDNYGGTSLRVFLGEGGGHFAEPLQIAAGGHVEKCRVGDFDGDHIPDLAVAARLCGEVRIFRGRGDGTFDAPIPFSGGSPFDLVPHDLNGDGAEDLIVIGGSVYALINQRGLTSEFMRGDANADGARNVADAVAMLSYLFGNGRTPRCLDAADANDDGAIDVADPIKLLRHLFASGGPLPEPFEACGDDPTADDQLSCAEFRPCG